MKKFLLTLLISFLLPATIFAMSYNDLLLNASSSNNIISARRALDNGANANYCPQYRLSPLAYAVKNKNYQLVQLLLNNNAKPNLQINDGYYTQTAIFYATYNNDFKIAELLLQSGADVNVQKTVNQNVNITITTSPKNKNYKSEYNITPEIRQLSQNATPLIFAIEKENSTLPPSLQLVTLFLNYGANVNQANQYGFTPLMAAANLKFASAKQVRLQIAQLLLDNGANLQTTDSDGRSALQYARDTKFTEMIELLEKRTYQ